MGKLSPRQTTGVCLVATVICAYVGHYGVALLLAFSMLAGARRPIAAAVARLRPGRRP